MTKIYALVSGQLILYVGKTNIKLKKRESNHRAKSNDCYSKYIPDYTDWVIILLEECFDENAIEREQYYYDTLNPLYNHRRPGQTAREYQFKYKRTEEYKERQRELRDYKAEHERRKIRNAFS